MLNIESNWQVVCEIKGENLFYNIKGLQQTDENIQWAFYIYFNNERINIRWYSSENKGVLKLKESGFYHISAFLKHGNNSPIIKNSNKVRYLAKEDRINISIFGSCVSRDIIEYDDENLLNLNTYIARQSIVSAVSPPVDLDLECIKLNSNFQKKMVYHDFIKNTFDCLRKDQSEYLIIDLIDERYELLSYINNETWSIITDSYELQISGFIKDKTVIKRYKKKKNILSNKYEYIIDNKKLTSYIDIFIDKILEIYSSTNIILHRAKMVDYYLDKSNNIKKFKLNYINNNKKVNELLDFMYDYIEERLEGCIVIDLSKTFIAFENHKWGLATMHYQEEYYIECMREIIKKIYINLLEY